MRPYVQIRKFFFWISKLQFMGGTKVLFGWVSPGMAGKGPFPCSLVLAVSTVIGIYKGARALT